MKEIIGLKVNERDNVAVVFSEDAKEDSTVIVRDERGDMKEIKLISQIPYGHKVAIKIIKTGEAIYKYGEEIGLATGDIKIGEHTHVHNVESNRSRGDKED